MRTRVHSTTVCGTQSGMSGATYSRYPTMAAVSAASTTQAVMRDATSWLEGSFAAAQPHTSLTVMPQPLDVLMVQDATAVRGSQHMKMYIYIYMVATCSQRP